MSKLTLDYHESATRRILSMSCLNSSVSFLSTAVIARAGALSCSMQAFCLPERVFRVQVGGVGRHALGNVLGGFRRTPTKLRVRSLVASGNGSCRIKVKISTSAKGEP
ncbi:MAG: hypothetical protein KGJ55_11160 [Gammaproteobacteria bacterium]|nr:hypothetical protein [Gammaproteobacteria bacterium]